MFAGSHANQLDATVHGRVAAAGLKRALEEGGELAERFLMAVQLGRLRKLELDVTDSAVDTEEVMQRVCLALCADQHGTAGTLTSVALNNSGGLKFLPDGDAQILFEERHLTFYRHFRRLSAAEEPPDPRHEQLLGSAISPRE